MSLAAEKRRKAKALEEAGAALSVKLSARSTRGQRISELQGDDAEADETFWGQGAWQEKEEDDSEFSSEEEEPDAFDEDFNESESEDEDDEGKEETKLRKHERAAKRKRPAGGVYKEPKRFVTAKKAVVRPGTSASEAGGAGTERAADAGGRTGSGAAGARIQRSVRASTKNKTEKSFKVREGEAKAREAQLKRSAPQPKTIKGQFTQKQLLLEAIQTEHENMRWILRQQRLEDEAKEDEARPKTHKTLASRYVSRRGALDTILFPDAQNLPAVLCQPPASVDQDAAEGAEEQPAEHKCKITHVRARYRDPLTGYPYADLAAFRELRKRYGAAAKAKQQEERQAKEAASKGGGGLGGAGAAGSRVENGGAATGAGAGPGALGAGSAVSASGAAGSGSLKGGGGSQQVGGQSSGSGKKQATAKEADKKSKSAVGKGKGKAKGSPKATAAAPPAPGDDDGAGKAGQDKAKVGTKRPRKQGAAAKGAKPAKRPFFAAAPGVAVAAAAPPVTGHEAELVPLKGNGAVTQGAAAADRHASPLSEAGVVNTTTASATNDQVAAAASPAPASACAQIEPAPPAAPIVVDVQGHDPMQAPLIATKVSITAPVATAGAAALGPVIGASAALGPVLGASAALGPVLGASAALGPVLGASAAAAAAQQHSAVGGAWIHNGQGPLGDGGAAEVANGWEDAVMDSSASPVCVGWQQPTQAATVPGRPPG